MEEVDSNWTGRLAEIWAKHSVAFAGLTALASAILAMSFLGLYLNAFDFQLIYLIDYGDILRFWIVTLGLMSIFVVWMLIVIFSWSYLNAPLPFTRPVFVVTMLVPLMLQGWHLVSVRPTMDEIVARLFATVVFYAVCVNVIKAFTTSRRARRIMQSVDEAQHAAIRTASSIVVRGWVLGAVACAVCFSSLAGAVYARSVKGDMRLDRTMEFKTGERFEHHNGVKLVIVTTKYIAFWDGKETFVRKTDDLVKIVTKRR